MDNPFIGMEKKELEKQRLLLEQAIKDDAKVIPEEIVENLNQEINQIWNDVTVKVDQNIRLSNTLTFFVEETPLLGMSIEELKKLNILKHVQIDGSADMFRSEILANPPEEVKALQGKWDSFWNKVSETSKKYQVDPEEILDKII